MSNFVYFHHFHYFPRRCCEIATETDDCRRKRCLVNFYWKFCQACSRSGIDFMLARKAHSALKLHEMLLLCDVELVSMEKFFSPFKRKRFLLPEAKIPFIFVIRNCTRSFFRSWDQKNKVIIIQTRRKIQSVRGKEKHLINGILFTFYLTFELREKIVENHRQDRELRDDEMMKSMNRIILLVLPFQPISFFPPAQKL